MKVSRVILASNDSENYYQFWNPLSKVYLEKFSIKPTLIWFGLPEAIESLDLSSEYGNIIVQTPVEGEPIGWQSAWSIFWFMSLYPDDIFCTMGIDQVPLSKMLIKDIPEPYDDDIYLTLVDDGYTPSHFLKEGGTSPSSYNICKGSTAIKVFGFESTFRGEIEKISRSGIKPYFDHGIKWGLDESWSSHKLRQAFNAGQNVKALSLFKLICEKRIECCRVNEVAYDPLVLSKGEYGDAHFCRPFSLHKEYIETILDLIPV